LNKNIDFLAVSLGRCFFKE